MGERAPEEAAGSFARVFEPRIFAPVLLIVAAGISWFYADRGLPNPDEGAALTAAAKVLRGAVFYRNIDAYPFPGAAYLLAGGMSVFGEHLAVARGLAGALYCVLVLSVYAAALRLVDRRRAALCAVILLSFKFFAFPNHTAYFYSDLATAAALLGLALFLRCDYRGFSLRLVLIGLCVGVALASKQNLGIYLGGAVGLLILSPALGTAPVPGGWSERFRGLAALALGVLLAFGPMVAYFASQGLLGKMLYSGLVRPFTGYAPTSGVPFTVPLRWWELGQLSDVELHPYLPIHYAAMIRFDLLLGSEWDGVHWLLGELAVRLLYTAVPVALGVCAVLWLRALRTKSGAGAFGQRAAFFANALVCLAVTASAFPRADFSHVIIIYPTVLLTLFSFANRPGDTNTNTAPSRVASRARLRFEAGAVALLLGVTLLLALRYNASLTDRIEMERAALWVSPRDSWVESFVAYVEDEVPPDRPIFVYGHEAHFYFLTGRYFPWPFAQLYPGMAGGDHGQALARVLAQARAPFIVKGLLYWPGIPNLPEYTPAVNAILKQHYAPETERLFERYPPPGERPDEMVFTLNRLKGLPRQVEP